MRTPTHPPKYPHRMLTVGVAPSGGVKVAGPKLMDFSTSRMHATATRARLAPGVALAAAELDEGFAGVPGGQQHTHKNLDTAVLEAAQAAAHAGQNQFIIRNQAAQKLRLGVHTSKHTHTHTHTHAHTQVRISSSFATRRPRLER